MISSRQSALGGSSLPSSMRALRKLSPQPGFVREDIAVPGFGATDVLVRVKKAGVCGTDANIYGGDHGEQRRVKPPLTPLTGKILELADAPTRGAPFRLIGNLILRVMPGALNDVFPPSQ